MDTRPPLTTRQAQVLDLIRDSVVQRGYPPSTREIGNAVGLASTSSVAHVVQVLEARGYITRVPGAPRTLVVRPMPSPTDCIVDLLAQEIRRVDGNHDLGAGALAEALMPWVDRYATGEPL